MGRSIGSERELLINVAGAESRRRTWTDRWRAATPWAAGLLVALCWDRAVYLHLGAQSEAQRHALEASGWYWALRNVGDIRYAWFPLAIVLVLVDLRRRSEGMKAVMRRGVFVLLCTGLSGGLAELLKPIVGRYKPENTEGWYRLAPLRERLTEWHDLGVASSHAAVAFAGAFALSAILPRGAPLFVAAAVGCALTRLLAGQHFLSDVYVAVLIAYLVARSIGALDTRNNRGVPISG